MKAPALNPGARQMDDLPSREGALRPGKIMLRIGERGRALRCIVVKVEPGGMVTVQPSRFSQRKSRIRAEDLSTDWKACHAEMDRRKAREPSDA